MCLFRAGKVIEQANKPETRDEDCVDVICRIRSLNTSYRGLGSFEVTVANMQKAARNHVDEVYVVGSVLLFQVPNLPNELDPFLQPLMNDLCEGFIEGYKVQYPKGITIPGFEQSNEETVRLLLLVWTADHPGQREMGKFLNQGK